MCYPKSKYFLIVIIGAFLFILTHVVSTSRSEPIQNTQASNSYDVSSILSYVYLSSNYYYPEDKCGIFVTEYITLSLTSNQNSHQFTRSFSSNILFNFDQNRASVSPENNNNFTASAVITDKTNIEITIKKVDSNVQLALPSTLTILLSYRAVGLTGQQDGVSTTSFFLYSIYIIICSSIQGNIANFYYNLAQQVAKLTTIFNFNTDLYSSDLKPSNGGVLSGNQVSFSFENVKASETISPYVTFKSNSYDKLICPLPKNSWLGILGGVIGAIVGSFLLCCGCIAFCFGSKKAYNIYVVRRYEVTVVERVA